MNRSAAVKRIQISFAACFSMLVLAPSGFASQRQSDVKSRLELAVSSAISEAKKCNIRVDDVEMTVSISDSTYRIEMFNPNVRGGGAVVIVERATAKVESLVCLQ